MMRNRGIHSEKFIERRRRKRQILLFLGALCFFTVAASGILLLRAPFLQIRAINVEGSNLVSSDKLSSAAVGSLGGSFLKIIPGSSVFFFSKDNIMQTFARDFKEVEDIKIHREGLSGLKVIVQERVPAAVVCAGFRGDSDADTCYLSDNQGYVFSKIGSTTDRYAALSHYYVSSEQNTISVGSNFVPDNRFKELQKFIKGASSGGLTPLGLLVSDNGEYEMYVKNKSGDSEVTVYFDDRSPFEKTLSNLLAFWQNSTSKATTTQNFDYINLRFGNTVYYSTN